MTEQDPAADLQRLVNGYQVSQAISVAATLGIADLLKDGPRTSDDLAAAAGAHPRALYRLLRALAAVGVFHEHHDQRFSLAPIGEFLRSDAAGSSAPWAAQIGRQYFWQAWGDLLHSVRTGENAFRHQHGTDVWTYRSTRPEDNAAFDRAMTGQSRRIDGAVVAAYDFSRYARIMDVGGGHGSLLAAILGANPSSKGVLFDQPHVVSGALALLETAGAADRCEVVGGSFFESVPDGADAHVLKQIIHDWEDGDATKILRACRRAINPDGTLLIVEHVVAPPNHAPAGKFMDLNMLVLPGGQERTRDEFAALFAAAGFRLTRVIPTASPASIIEGIPA